MMSVTKEVGSRYYETVANKQIRFKVLVDKNGINENRMVRHGKQANAR